MAATLEAQLTSQELCPTDPMKHNGPRTATQHGKPTARVSKPWLSRSSATMTTFPRAKRRLRSSASWLSTQVKLAKQLEACVCMYMGAKFVNISTHAGSCVQHCSCTVYLQNASILRSRYSMKTGKDLPISSPIPCSHHAMYLHKHFVLGERKEDLDPIRNQACQHTLQGLMSTLNSFGFPLNNLDCMLTMTATQRNPRLL